MDFSVCREQARGIREEKVNWRTHELTPDLCGKPLHPQRFGVIHVKSAIPCVSLPQWTYQEYSMVKLLKIVWHFGKQAWAGCYNFLESCYHEVTRKPAWTQVSFCAKPGCSQADKPLLKQQHASFTLLFCCCFTQTRYDMLIRELMSCRWVNFVNFLQTQASVFTSR